VLTLASRIDRRMFDPSPVCIPSGEPLEKSFAEARVPERILGYQGLTKNPALVVPRLLQASGTISGFAGLLRKEEEKILHASLPEASVLGTMATRRHARVRLSYRSGRPANTRDGTPYMHVLRNSRT
jgi:hypothetical protein